MLLYAFACFPLTWLISEELQVSDQIVMGSNLTKIFVLKIQYVHSICIYDKSNDKSNHPAFLPLVIFCLLSNFLTWLVPTSIILEQSATRIIFSWTVVSLFSVRPRYWSNDLYSAWRIDGRKHEEQPQYINYNTALYVQPSQWWRVGQAKFIHRFASVLASPATYLSLSPPPPFLPAYQSSYCRQVIT